MILLKEMQSTVDPGATDMLEQGHVLFFSQLSFHLNPSENRFLSPRYADHASKNISLNSEGSLRASHCSSEEHQALKKMLARFSGVAEDLVESLFPSYKAYLKKGRTSFRPIEIEGRKPASYRKDDTRLHVDAFPATPNQGQRILRVFTNINPNGQSRHWRLGEDFEKVAEKFLPQTKKMWPGQSLLLRWLKITKSTRTEYDHRMLQIHDKMKADLNYQKSVQYTDVYFPPNSTWVVYTDCVSHAAISGQHVLEQTFYLPVEAMRDPSRSPFKIIENRIKKERSVK